ncbi:(2Fe-2S)-binding protein [Nesterenkonia sp. F]|uniref:(2Fe-2S)-binding protein n=1 Tax=Nesterenkonia sp. F TaxID=795955 RepID=UPI0013030497|nr:(2Fe-2S)-binding protein [Nesterenkonia sp. F]
MKSKTLSVACAGTTQVDPWAPDAPTVSTWSDPQAGQYLRIVTEGERLLGFVSVGMARTAAELSMHATRGTLPVADRTALVAAQHATAEQELGPDDVLCRCSGATAGMVAEAAETCSTVDEVGAACRAGTGCGTCRSSIEKVLAAAPAGV